MNTVQSLFQSETESKKVTKSNFLCSVSVVYVTAVRNCTKGFIKSKVYLFISMFHRAFFNSIIDEHQHMHFFTFKTVLV